MSYLGSWAIDDVLTFYANTTRFDTGAATDADADPPWRVYENETGTALLNGTMSLLDSSNTAGFYSEAITLSAANGFELGKQYAVYIAATVNSVAGATHHTFQIGSKVNTTHLAGTAQTARDIGASVLLSSGTGTGQVLLSSGKVVTPDDQKVDVNTIKTQTVTAAAGVTFPTSIASPTNITAGTITTATNLTNNNDKTGYVLSATGSAALTEGYAADGATFTLNQGLYMIWSLLAERAISSTTLTASKLDGTTPAMTFTLDDDTNPATQTRAT